MLHSITLVFKSIYAMAYNIIKLILAYILYWFFQIFITQENDLIFNYKILIF